MRYEVPSEEVEQTCLFRWAMLMEREMPELKLLHAIPNGGKRSKAEAARMKAAGVKAGVPDMCLPVPRGTYSGLYIELKRQKGGRLSNEQMEWLGRLRKQGYAAYVCYGWQEAAGVIHGYLKGDQHV